MTYVDIKNADYEERERKKAKREKEVYNMLSNILVESGYEVSDIEINFEKYEEAGSIEYHFKLSDGFEQNDDYYWKWDESVEEATQKIKKHIDYVEELRKQYPDYASQNDHIQKYREYRRVCKIYDDGFAKEAYLKAELCEYLKLPNTTSCGFGGGDYEIKRTPRRVKDFNENIDRLCLFLSDCIAELRGMKIKESEISQ